MHDNIFLWGAAPSSGTDWIAIITCISTAAGAVILYVYTRFTGKLVDYTKELARLAEESLKEARAGSAAALAEAEKSYEATKTSNEIAERSLVLGRRAWVVIHGAPMWSNEAQGWSFGDVIVENVSDMPAVIQQYGTGYLAEEVETLSLNEWQKDEAGLVVIRGKPVGLGFRDVQAPPKKEDEDVIDAMAILHAKIYCVVEYTDCFKKNWRSAVCWYENADDVWQPIPGYTTLE